MYYRARKSGNRTKCVHKEAHEIPNLAYYTNQISAIININNGIPLNEVLLLGDAIKTVGATSVRLDNGVYDISFTLVSSTNAVGSGISSVTLFSNESPTNISASQSFCEGGVHSLSARGIYVSTNNSEELRLINTSTNAQQFSSLNLVIQKIS